MQLTGLSTEDVMSRVPRNSGRGHAARGEQLLEAFAHAREGTGETCLIVGDAGMGKTTLLSILKPTQITSEHWWGSGSALEDEHHDHPVLRAALWELCTQVLAEPGVDHRAWLAQLRSTLAGHFEAISQWLPILWTDDAGADPSTPTARDTTIINWAAPLRRLLVTVASLGRPIVLALDDLHRASRSTLALIHELATAAGLPGTLLVASGRPGSWQQRFTAPTGHGLITVEGLAVDDIEPMLAASLGATAPAHGHRELAQQLVAQVGPSPARLLAALEYALRQQIIRFDPDDGHWTYDRQRLQAAEIPNHWAAITDFQLDALDPTQREVAELLACVGQAIDRPSLHQLSTLDPDPLDKAVDQLVAQDICRWTHERVTYQSPDHRDSVYNAMEPQRRESQHADIVRWAQRSSVVSELAADAEFLALQFTRSAEAFRMGQRMQMLECQTRAGSVAIAQARPHDAQPYFSRALELIDDSAWGMDPDICLQACIGYAQTSDTRDQQETALQALDNAREHCTRAISGAAIAREQIRLHSISHESKRAVAVGLGALARLGLELPAEPRPLRILLAVWSIERRLRRLQLDDIKSLPRLDDERIQARSEILSAMSGAAFACNPQLFVLLQLEQLRISLDHGFHSASPHAVFLHATIVAHALRNFARARDIVSAAQQLDASFGDPKLRPRAALAVCVTINAFTQPYAQTLQECDAIASMCEDTGDTSYFIYQESMALAYAMYAGTPCKPLLARVDRGLDFRRRRAAPLQFHDGLRAIVQILATNPEPVRRSELVGELVSPLCQPQAWSDRSAYQHWMSVACLPLTALGEFELAFEGAKPLLEHEEGENRSLSMTPELFFGCALALARCLETCAKHAEGSYETWFVHCRSRLRRWAGFAPHNLAHRAELIDGEWALHRGNHEAARRAFQSALDASWLRRELHLCGYIQSRLARTAHELGHRRQAMVDTLASAGDFRELGWEACVQQLEAGLSGPYAPARTLAARVQPEAREAAVDLPGASDRDEPEPETGPEKKTEISSDIVGALGSGQLCSRSARHSPSAALESIASSAGVAQGIDGVEEPNTPVDPSETAANSHPTEPRILLVEDNRVNRRLATKMLGKLGLDCREVENGALAVEAFNAQPWDLVLMDCDMPVMDGYEATQRIRAIESQATRPKCQIVAMTAHALPEQRERCFAVGMDEHISKPVSIEGLREVIERHTRGLALGRRAS